ncbi:MAG: double-cubane-cluster-containing anaerobic reductase [Desulfatirhabdiaceae bacterium]
MKPSGLRYFETCNERCLAELETAHDAGKSIAGVYCIFAPAELIRAAGAIPVGLCGKKQAPIARAEEELPANLCPLIKSSYGYAVSDTCPYFAASDFIVGETTCDGKKKMFELLGRIKPLHMIHLPYLTGDSHALDFWQSEFVRFQGFLEHQTGITVTDAALLDQIRLTNRMKKAFLTLLENYRLGRLALTGSELLVLLETKGFIVNPEAYIQQLESLNKELDMIPVRDNSSQPRVLLTGTPVGKGSDKVLKILESAGAQVVVQENCSGIKSLYYPIDETLAADNPMKALAKRYLELPCACMSPNPNRYQLLERLIHDFEIQGVVDLTWQCCHTYNVESYPLLKWIDTRFGIPTLHLETDYSESDIGQLQTRIEAFLELI